MNREPEVPYIIRDNLTEEQIAEAKETPHDLARLLGRISAKACHEMGIEFDIDDPEAAREVTKMTVEGLFYSSPSRGTRKARGPAPAELPD